MTRQEWLIALGLSLLAAAALVWLTLSGDATCSANYPC